MILWSVGMFLNNGKINDKHFVFMFLDFDTIGDSHSRQRPFKQARLALVRAALYAAESGHAMTAPISKTNM